MIEHSDSGEQFESLNDELDWETVGDDKTGMGLETVYEALVEHDELGNLRRTISEYPAGAESFMGANVGIHRAVQYFDYGLEHEPEFNDDVPANFRDRLKNDPEWTRN